MRAALAILAIVMAGCITTRIPPLQEPTGPPSVTVLPGADMTRAIAELALTNAEYSLLIWRHMADSTSPEYGAELERREARVESLRDFLDSVRAEQAK